ncbi:MAG: DUF523 domain-containing protein [Deltaproteobacteria bacterium]|nr:DUF523 domain-containing protein [Deltaproteobacteria bacterium]MBW1738458.1 DUF523 domain-containing protein [Deltaproteobacteria bacterium]MBW2115718.1 DUF523 domain-containing protein [Deltaproteobacteria bacterium]MBW2170301.1 DUF523 domain-containing protein [Deltaproteobacteria bacterium]MBW2358901.1 DUF523 domain-containing protein [Deltaproteobacteria bacterium]
MREPSNSQTESLLLQKKAPVMISACLLGIHCRYDGRHASCPDLIDFVTTIPFIPFCPEQLGGLPTPRSPADIKGGDGRDILSGRAKIINADGDDVTEAFKNGAYEALHLARLSGSFIAVMKDSSPSCGLHTQYCEKPSGFGIGIAAALFESSGIRIFELRSNDTFPTRNFLKLIEENH